VRRALVALLLGLGVTACSSSTAPVHLPSGVDAGVIAGHPALQAGHGATAIVMVHGATTHKEQWLVMLPPLARAGYRAIALDLGPDRKAAVEAAINDARETGATRIVLFGSSLGAQDALEEASATGRATDIAAVVTFSAVVVRTAPTPVLAIASEHDPNADTVSIARTIASGSGHDSTTIVVSGSTHGADLVQQHREVIDEVIRWLHAAVP
jgi:pimeloyl-ACP methyl ester carboxylesterase